MSTVAAIIPTYNRAQAVQRAIESVRAQTYSDLEIIVVDDGSDDDTADILGRYSDCLYIRTAHSGLPAVARNAGVEASSAEYLAFLDSDDEWLPQKLLLQMQAMEFKSCGLVCSNAYVISTDPGIPSGPYLPAREKAFKPTLRELVLNNFVIASSVVVKRESFEAAGGFNEDPRLRGLEDYDLWLRIADSTRLHYIDQELVRYHRSIAGLSGQNTGLAYWQAMELVFSSSSRFSSSVTLTGLDRRLAATYQMQLDACRRSICDEYLAQGQRRDFAKRFAAFVFQSPLGAAKYLAAKMLL
jgi:glycosyltransferase involved in cell wall biosynthesis